MEINIDLVRSLLGKLGVDIPDSTIDNPAMLAIARAHIAGLCPTWEQITGDDIETLDVVIAHVVAAHLLGSAAGTGGEVRSMSLGDQSMTYSDGYVAAQRDGLHDDARLLLAGVCPVTPKPTGMPVAFTTASGGRARQRRR